MKKPIKSKNRKVSGVLGGVAEYYCVDPTLIRVGYLFLLIFTGLIPGVIFYVVAALLIPDAFTPPAPHHPTDPQQSDQAL